MFLHNFSYVMVLVCASVGRVSEMALEACICFSIISAM